jgi:hypothetical protein
MGKKKNIILCLVASGAVLGITALIFITTYFRIISRAFTQPGGVGREFAAYDSWSGFVTVLMCVSGGVFYIMVRLFFKKDKSTHDHLK